MDNGYVERARILNEKGYNCAQSVACAFTDLVGLDEQTLFALTNGFGGGMGGHDATCGAVSGAVAILSLLNSGKVVDPANKAATYAKVASLVSSFEEKNQSLVCKTLRGEENGIVLRSCPGCIEDAVLLVQKLLQNNSAIC